jgi:GDP-4-dehydro-6-deoxy-D-mannose reductase
MRSLITGIGGFAGGHLTAALLERDAEVAGIDRVAGPRLETLGDRVAFTAGDIRDADAIRAAASGFHPEVIFHLAAITHVGQAWTQRRETLEINVVGTAALLEVAAELDPKPTVVLASTGQVYGPAPPDSHSMSEDDPTHPQSPYAVSKMCAELLARQAWEGEGVPTIILRTFNYTGPWQSPSFVCSDFARQVAWVEAGLTEPRMSVGNLEARRDFSDVRDVVDGYLLAAEHGRPGEAYNLASGEGVRIAEVLEYLRGAVSVDVDVQQDGDRLRAADLVALLGDATRAREELGWKPRYKFEETLDSVLEFWRKQAASEPR